jgi:aminoglycoside phosphotransferase (APT) family kinase protein
LTGPTLAVPVEVTDVTAAWLSAALATTVRDVEVLAAHSGTTGRARLGLRYERDEGQPASVFVKLAPFDERQRRFVDAVGLGVAEARFYRDVAATVPVRVPYVWHAAVDGSRYVMVLEDLVAAQARFPRPDDGDLDEFVGRLVDELARLHAQFWAAPELAVGSLAFVGDGTRLAFGAGGSFVGHAVERFAAELPPVFAELGARYVADAPAIAALWDLEPRTLAHGDAHLGNLFIDGGRPGFFDWAMVMPRAGMWDVAYVLCGSVPRGVRRAHETEWIRRYCTGLAGAGVKLDEAEAWEQYRLFALYAWVSATSTAGVGTRFQRADIARGGMVRATAAVDDLDSLGALSAALNARS